MKDSCPAEFTRIQKSRKVDLAHAKLIVCGKSLNTSVVVVRRRPLLWLVGWGKVLSKPKP